MGCATESLCWSKLQQVNIFSARGGPICWEDELWTQCCSVISSKRSSLTASHTDMVTRGFLRERAASVQRED
ncbi:hypothetical protein F7725_012591 [Dissostichus mawsoni]|uniref:Uncharacterized protein n=1 Tax=Dissostichus mawsoni TaxID=36200 RepID=A0A7J5YQ07_DISMA|nr:hypothetical protein F7725_012591 [Dissostichus mawsoni]